MTLAASVLQELLYFLRIKSSVKDSRNYGLVFNQTVVEHIRELRQKYTMKTFKNAHVGH